MKSTPSKQRGAALIIVLLLAATLSFLVLAMATLMTQSSRRTSGAATRAELLWRIVGAETLAAAAIEDAIRIAAEGGPKLGAGHPLFSEQLLIPFPNGSGSIIFADAGRCFNLNSLGAAQGDPLDDANAGPTEELVQLLTEAGANEGDARNFAAVVKDWIDPDSNQEIGGAEDGFYTGLPTPYRTGGAPIASLTELRAMRGVTSALYAAAAPFVCALPTDQPAIVNVNALTPEDGPVLTALTGGAVDGATARDIIANRPPGGWTSVEQFWSAPALQDVGSESGDIRSRTAIGPQFIQARAGATVNEIDMNVSLMFSAVDGQNVVLLSREIGSR